MGQIRVFHRRWVAALTASAVLFFAPISVLAAAAEPVAGGSESSLSSDFPVGIANDSIAPIISERPSWVNDGASAPLVDDTVDITDLEGVPSSSDISRRSTAAEDPASKVAASAHKIEIAVVATPGTGSNTHYVDNESIIQIVAGVASYWTGQTEGQVASLSRDTEVKRYVSGASCSQQEAAWTEAASC